jgi:hypothetical protein
MENLDKDEVQKNFSLNKQTYNSMLKHVYEAHNKLKPKYLFEFQILLPFQLPIVEGSSSTYVMDDEKACTFRFSYFSLDSITSFIEENLLTASIKKTKVQMIYAETEEIKFPIDEKVLTEVFDKLLLYLNRLISAYLVFSKDIDAYQLTKEMLEPISVARVITLDDWENEWAGIFIKNINFHHVKDDINAKTFSEILWYSHVIEKNLNPFIPSEELLINSERYFKMGFFKEAVIFSQTSVEVFLTNLFHVFLQSEGFSENDILSTVEDTPFISMVKHQFSRRIGGNWNLGNEGTPVGQWYRDTYLLRNKVVHSGYMPNKNETYNCIGSSLALKKFIIIQLKKQRKRYVEILKFFEKNN